MADTELAQNLWPYQQIIEHAPFGVMLVDARDPQLPIVYINPAFETITGYTAAEVLGRNPDFLLGSDQQALAGELAQWSLAQPNEFPIILRNYRKDGTMFWNELHVSPLRNPAGEIIHFVGTQKDVTVREEAKLALERSERRYYQMFDSHTAIKLLIDVASGQIKDANTAAADFYGYSCAQLKSMRIGELNTLPEAEIRENLDRASTRKTTFFEFEHRLASGEIRDVDVYTSPVDMPDGRALYSIIVDVTGKRQAASQYAALFEQSNDAVFILDLDGQHQRVNQRAAELFGYSVAELEQLSYRTLIMPDEQTAEQNAFARLLHGDHLAPYERTFRHKDGTPIFTEVNIELVRDNRGLPRHFQSVVRDITQRKLFEQALREGEQKFRTVVEQSIDGIVLTDEWGSIIEWNAGMAVISGVDAAHALGRPIWDVQFELGQDHLKSPEVYTSLKLNTIHTLQTGNASWFAEPRDSVVQRPDGSTRSVQGVLFPIRTANGYRIGSILRDMTERNNTEEALRASEAMFRMIAENVSDGIVIFNADSRVAYASPNFDRQSGRIPGATLGLSLDEFVEALHPDDRAPMLMRIGAAIAQQAANLTLTYRVRHSNGSYFWQEDHARFNYSPDGDYLSTYVVARDITERKRGEEAEFSLRLEKERTRLLTNFFQDAAHEFSTPLSSLNTGLYLLTHMEDRERRARKAQQMEMEIDRINRLIRSLVLLMKAESADTFARVPLDFSDVVRTECLALEMTFRGQPALHTALPTVPVFVFGDAEYLRSAVHEVLHNAYRFTPPEGHISVTLTLTATEAHLEIADTGIGLAAADLPHIFDTFWRLDEAHTTPGFGLGLPIAKRIIEQHDGIIHATSEFGVGSRFVIVLPATR
ncbi:MAG: PAS domain S-box protein [Chloroflexi bacterium]|nr:PAS domain S-box protein [Chloroflexota bacterium]